MCSALFSTESYFNCWTTISPAVDKVLSYIISSYSACCSFPFKQSCLHTKFLTKIHCVSWSVPCPSALVVLFTCFLFVAHFLFYFVDSSQTLDFLPLCFPPDCLHLSLIGSLTCPHFPISLPIYMSPLPLFFVSSSVLLCASVPRVHRVPCVPACLLACFTCLFLQ